MTERELAYNDMMIVLDIMDSLDNPDYDFTDEEGLIETIEKYGIDMSGFILPYGCKSVQEWKNIVEARGREFAGRNNVPFDFSRKDIML